MGVRASPGWLCGSPKGFGCSTASHADFVPRSIAAEARMSDQIGIQLSIARAVWAAHIHHASGLSAANMALQGKTAASVANWFLRHSELVLNSTLRRATLQDMLNQQGNNRGPYRDVLETLLLIDAPITPAEILSMVCMDSSLSSVLGAARPQLPRSTISSPPHSASPSQLAQAALLASCGRLPTTPLRYSSPVRSPLSGSTYPDSSFGNQALNRWQQHPECPLCGLELRQLAAGVENSVQAERSRDQHHLESLLENEKQLHRQALELSQRNHELDMVDLKHSLLMLETKHARALAIVEEQAKLDVTSKNTRTDEMTRLQDALVEKTLSVQQYSSQVQQYKVGESQSNLTKEMLQSAKEGVEQKLLNSEQRIHVQLTQIANITADLTQEQMATAKLKQQIEGLENNSATQAKNEIQDLKDNHGKQLKQQVEESEAEVKDLKGSFAKQLSMTNEEKVAEIQKLQNEIKDLKDDHAKQLAMSNEEKGAELHKILMDKDQEVMNQKLQAADQLEASTKKLADQQEESAKKQEESAKKLADQLEGCNKKLAEEIAVRDQKLADEISAKDQKLADEIAERDAKLADMIAGGDQKLSDEIAERDQKLADEVAARADDMAARDKEIAEEVAARAVVEQQLAAKQAELNDVLSRDTDTLLTEAKAEFAAAKAELKEQAAKHKGQLVDMMDSAEADLKAAKKKKTKELKKKDAELAEEKKQNMGLLVKFQDEVDAEKERVKELEDKIETLVSTM